MNDRVIAVLQYTDINSKLLTVSNSDDDNNTNNADLYFNILFGG